MALLQDLITQKFPQKVVRFFPKSLFKDFHMRSSRIQNPLRSSSSNAFDSSLSYFLQSFFRNNLEFFHENPREFFEVVSQMLFQKFQQKFPKNFLGSSSRNLLRSSLRVNFSTSNRSSSIIPSGLLPRILPGFSGILTGILPIPKTTS